MKQKNVILMVVAVGCGLVAAFLTSQMSGKTIEQVDVVVAAKDLPVGTVFSQNDLKTLVKTKKVPKDGLPPAYVTTPEELLDKRLSRPIRAEETFNPQDLNKGMALPEGCDLVALPIGSGSAASGFVVPGCRVDVTASLKLGNTLKVFRLLVNTLIVNVNQDTTNSSKTGAYPDVNQVGLALTEKESVLLELARARGCTLTIKLRNTLKTAEADKDYNLEETIKLLQDVDHPTVVKPGNDVVKPKPEGTEGKPEPKPEVKPEAPKAPEVAFAPPPAIKVVKVLVAIRAIEPNTPITNDLIVEAFEWKELPKDFAADALTDFNEASGKAFKVGVAKGQWVTREMLGLPASKPGPQDSFVPPKPGPADPVAPVAPVEQPKPVRKYVDVAVHTANGTVVHRYEEVAGKLKKIAELTPEQAAETNKPEAPKAAPNARKAD